MSRYDATMAIDERRMRFTVERYERLLDADIFSDDERVELIDGEIYEIEPMKPDHATVVTLLVEQLTRELGARASVRVQCDVRLPPDAEPVPDVALAEPPTERTATAIRRPRTCTASSRSPRRPTVATGGRRRSTLNAGSLKRGSSIWSRRS